MNPGTGVGWGWGQGHCCISLTQNYWLSDQFPLQVAPEVCLPWDVGVRDEELCLSPLVYVCSSPPNPLSVGDTFQDPEWVPETTACTEPYIHYAVPYIYTHIYDKV